MDENTQMQIVKVQEAKDALEFSILEGMVMAAKERGLTEFYLLPSTNEYLIGDARVLCPAINDWEELYLEHIHPGGLYAHWCAEKGWS